MAPAPMSVEEKAPKPPGLLPKNIQSWLLVSLAILMVAIMWLTGGKKPPVPAKPLGPVATAQPPLEVNEAKIVELQNRIQELQREQMVAESALAQQSHLLGSAPPERPATASSALSAATPPEHAEDPILAERKKREYLARFASNVALSYRRIPTANPHEQEHNLTPAPAPDGAQLAELLRPFPPPALPANPPPSAKDSVVGNALGKEESNPHAAAVAGAPSAAAGKNYLLFEGTILETVLINRLDGQFAGPVECLLTTDIYSHDRQHLLVPAGAKLIGESKKVETFGQNRLAVSFHRLIMPDGFSVSFDHFVGLNQVGDTGLHDQVNQHYLRIFGASLAIGLLGAVAEGTSGGVLTASGGDLLRQGFAQSTAQSSAQILDKFLNVLPTVSIREGHRVKVYLAGDLLLPDYQNHRLPSDL
jgi:type IV secretory pathway VirB10-like protein